MEVEISGACMGMIWFLESVFKNHQDLHFISLYTYLRAYPPRQYLCKFTIKMEVFNHSVLIYNFIEDRDKNVDLSCTK